MTKPKKEIMITQEEDIVENVEEEVEITKGTIIETTTDNITTGEMTGKIQIKEDDLKFTRKIPISLTRGRIAVQAQ